MKYFSTVHPHSPFFIFSTILVFALFSFVLVANAQGSLIPCGGTGQPACTFDHLITLVQRVINFLIVDIAIPLSMVLFAWAGFLYMTAQGDPGKIKTGHTIFISVIWGLVIALAAWLIVNTITTALLTPGFKSQFFFLKQ